MKTLYSLKRFYPMEMLFNKILVVVSCDKKTTNFFFGGPKMPNLSIYLVNC